MLDTEQDLRGLVAMGERVKGDHEHAAMRAARAAAADDEIMRRRKGLDGSNGAVSGLASTAVSDFARRVLRPNQGWVVHTRLKGVERTAAEADAKLRPVQAERPLGVAQAIAADPSYPTPEDTSPLYRSRALVLVRAAVDEGRLA